MQETPREWLGPEGEAAIKEWERFKDDDLYGYFAVMRNPYASTQYKHLVKAGEIGRYAEAREHPTLGDNIPNAHVVKVPWGCGLNLGPCSTGLAGYRCSEKEPLRGHWTVIRFLQEEGLSDAEMQRAIEHEEWIRHLEDIRAIELERGPAKPILYNDTPALRAEHRRLSTKRIRWEIDGHGGVSNRFQQPPLYQLWYVISSLWKFTELCVDDDNCNAAICLYN